MTWLFVSYITQAVLWLLVVGLAVSVIRLQRSVDSVRHMVEGRAAEGPEIGRPAPKLLNTGDEDASEFPLPTDGRATILWFMAAACVPCRAIRGTIGAIATDYGERAHSVVNCVGNQEEVVEFASGIEGPVHVMADPSRTNVNEWRVYITPFLIVVDSRGTVSRKVAEVAIDRVTLAVDAVLSSEDHR